MEQFEFLSSGFTLMFSIFFLAAISGFLSEKLGIINIGINGLMVFGALIFALLGHSFNSNNVLLQLLALIIACLLTGLFASLHSIAVIKFRANQIISGFAINMLAAGIGLFFVNIRTLSVSSKIFTKFDLISLDGKTGIFNIFLIISILFLIGLLLFFQFSKFGVRYKSIGENPYVGNSLGININKTRYIGLFFSGVIAGLAGCAFTFYTANSFEGGVQGQGFIALAILIFGQWRILNIFLAAVFFSFLWTIATYLPLMKGIAKVIADNSILLNIIPFLFTIISMIIFSKRSKMPKSLGLDFNKEFKK